MINYSIWLNFWKWVFIIWGFCYKLYVQVNSWFLKYNWTVFNALEHASFVYSVPASYRVIFSSSFFLYNRIWCNLPFIFFIFFLWFLFYLFFPTLSIMIRKTRAHRTSTFSSTPAFDRNTFQIEKNQETYEKLNIFRSVWAERKVVLDELDPEIRRNFERKGWLPLLDINHPPLATLIRKFYLNLSIHSNDSNTRFVKSWIWGEEYVITPSAVTSALGVPKV